jgi:superfamily I DNA and/or RNA helicase
LYIYYFTYLYRIVLYCTIAGDPVLQERFFEVLVLDEATQAPEPAALVAVAQKVGLLFAP